VAQIHASRLHHSPDRAVSSSSASAKDGEGGGRRGVEGERGEYRGREGGIGGYRGREGGKRGEEDEESTRKGGDKVLSGCGITDSTPALCSH